ncbi:MAG: hypothetical protein Q8S09_12395, partial [Hyphomonas sp.]|nr:hypothetical protein [Hyphomonas sp.]
MGWDVNLPASTKRGVDVNVRRHPSGGLIVLIRLWPDVFHKLGWAQGDAVEVLEGGGEDAGKLMLRPADEPGAAHVRRLGAPGSGDVPGHLTVAVHWPAYDQPMPPAAAPYELPGGDLKGALVLTMPPPPAASAARPPGRVRAEGVTARAPAASPATQRALPAVPAAAEEPVEALADSAGAEPPEPGAPDQPPQAP